MAQRYHDGWPGCVRLRPSEQQIEVVALSNAPTLKCLSSNEKFYSSFDGNELKLDKHLDVLVVFSKISSIANDCNYLDRLRVVDINNNKSNKYPPPVLKTMYQQHTSLTRQPRIKLVMCIEEPQELADHDR